MATTVPTRVKSFSAALIQTKNFSFIIQHFADTFRQSIIDLLQGKLHDYRELREDDIYETIICVAQTNLIPETPAPTGYFNHGVLQPEFYLAESLFDLTRSERF